MVDLMHLIEVSSVKHSMSPIKEEILDEVDNKDLNENLAEFWEIIEAEFYAFYVCEENSDWVDN